MRLKQELLNGLASHHNNSDLGAKLFGFVESAESALLEYLFKRAIHDADRQIDALCHAGFNESYVLALNSYDAYRNSIAKYFLERYCENYTSVSTSSFSKISC